MTAIKIFEMNDCDWWAGETREEVIAAYMADQGITLDEASSAYELSEEALDNLQYYHDGDRHKESMTFREGLTLRISEGETFPCLFATTEF